MRHRTLAAAVALAGSWAFQLSDSLAAAPATSPAQISAQTPIGLQQNILVESDMVLLSDIFFGLPPESRFAGTPLARAPRPGERIGYSVAAPIEGTSPGRFAGSRSLSIG